MADKTTMARVTISRQLQGAPGAPGADAVMYDIMVSPESWTIISDGTPTKSNMLMQVICVKGETRTNITSNLGNVPLYKVEITGDGVDITSRMIIPSGDTNVRSIPTSDTGGKAYEVIEIRFYNRASSSSEWVLQQIKTIAPAKDGLPGMEGRVRAPMRITRWSASGAPADRKYYPGDKDGDLYTDIVLYVNQATGDKSYWLCKENYTALPSDYTESPEKIYLAGSITGGGTGKRIFGRADNFSLIATDLLLAQRAFIRNLIVQELITSLDLNATGKRVEIKPEEYPAMKVYDNTGALRCEYSGEKYTEDNLISNLGGNSWNMTSVNRYEQGGVSDSDWQEMGSVVIPANGNVSIVCDLEASADPAVYNYTASPATRRGITAKVEIRLTSASSISGTLTSSLQASSGDDTVTKHSQCVTLSAVNNTSGEITVHLQSRFTFTYTGTGTEQINAAAGVQAREGTTAGTSNFLARYFANGFLLQSATNDYVLALSDETKGMCFRMENFHGAGLCMDDEGVKFKNNNNPDWILLT